MKKSTQQSIFNAKSFMLFFVQIFVCGFLYCQAPSHDPSRMIQNNDGSYWIFTTGDGIWCMSSDTRTFSSWTAMDTPFESGSYPDWVDDYVEDFDGAFWAPDVIKIDDTYYLYYSCAGTGTAAAIGLTTATDLEGPWTDQGMIVADDNAIDPSILLDDDTGKLWMAYGNWVGGIDLVELDASTGLRKNSTTYNLIDADQDVEGPGLLKNGDYYYLFFQRGLCCNGVNSTYYVQVGRSTSITGPYVDKDGVELSSDGGNTFLKNQDGRYIGPGHIGYGCGMLTYHYYDGNDDGSAKLRIRSDFGYDDDDWPYAKIASGNSYSIVNRNSDMALDVENCSTDNNTNVQQYSWLDNDCQKWVFTEVDDLTYRISPNIDTDMALDVENCSSEDETNVQMYSWLDNDCQKFTLTDMGGGYSKIVNVATEMCLYIEDSSTEDEANVVMKDCSTGGAAMQFSLEDQTTKSTALSQDIGQGDICQNSLSVQPNPSDGNFQIELNDFVDGSDVDITILNLNGKIVLQLKESAQSIITVNEDLDSGLYFMKLRNENKVYTAKLVVK